MHDGMLISITMLFIASICLYSTDHWIGGSILMFVLSVSISRLNK